MILKREFAINITNSLTGYGLMQSGPSTNLINPLVSSTRALEDQIKTFLSSQSLEHGRMAAPMF